MAALPGQLLHRGWSLPEPALAGQVLLTVLSAAALIFGTWWLGSRGP
jgi:hypothetical protein